MRPKPVWSKRAGGVWAIAGDVGDERFCQQAVQDTIRALGRLDVLVNNAAEQHPQESLDKITSEQLERTFRTNIFSSFYMTKAALTHLRAGAPSSTPPR